LTILGEVLPEIVLQIVEILPQIISAITENIPVLLEAAVNFLMAIVQAIPKIIPPLVDALPQIIDSIIDLWLESYPFMIESAIQLLLAIVDAIPLIIPPLVAAIPEIIFELVKGIVQAYPTMLEAAQKLFLGIAVALKNIGPTLLQYMINLVKMVKDNLVEKLKNIMNFKWELPKLKLPRFSIKPAGWEIGDLLKGKIPTLGITWNAKGGVFDSPTLFSYGNSLQGIGEDGAEAVVPLENNLEWLDKMASMLSNRLSGNNRPIVLQVDGKTFARTAIDTMNTLTRQQGKLTLNFV
jgi:hypothetical protein